MKMKFHMPVHFYFTVLSTFSFLLQCSAQQGLYVSNSTHILRAKSATEWSPLTITPKSNPVKLGRVVGLAIDVVDQYLFWSDIKAGYRGIFRSKLDGSQAEIIVSDVIEVNSITLDWSTKHIYYTDSRRQTVEVCDYAGENRRVLVVGDMSSPRGIFADPDNSYLYWNDQGKHTIERSRLDGSDRKVIVANDVFWPNQMDIDWTRNKLVWVDAANGTLMNSDLDGNNINQVASLVSQVGQNAVYGLALIGSDAYVSVWKSGKVLSVSTSGTVTEKATSLGDDSLFSMVYKRTGYPRTVTNICRNKDCAKLCLPTNKTSARCSCPSFGGKTLGADGKSCGDPTNILLFASAEPGYVGFISLDGASVPEAYMVAWTLRPVGLGYDPSTQMVYCSDVLEKKIRRVKLDGSGMAVVLSSSDGLGVVDGLLVDWEKGRLFYANMGFQSIDGYHYTWHSIEMVSLTNLQERRTIVSKCGKPRGLAIDNSKNHLLFTDWDTGVLMQANLDGSGKVQVMRELDNPNHIAYSNNIVFLLDSHYKTRQKQSKTTSKDGKLYIIKSNGEYKEVGGIRLKTPFGITVDTTKRIIVSDWELKSIISITSDDWSANNPVATSTVLLENIGMPMGLLKTRRTSATTPAPLTCTCDVCLGASPSGTTCSCSSNDFKILSQNTCKVPGKFLVFADMSSIKMIGLESSDRSVYTIIQSNSYYDNFVSIVYDSTAKTLYYTDVNRNNIYSSILGSGKRNLFYNASQQIDGMFLSGRQLYWTAFKAGHIATMKLDDVNSYKVLVSNLNKPRAVQVTHQYIVFTEWGDTPRIARASLSGTDVTTIVEDGLKWPNALFVDNANSKLYFGDGGTKKIFQCDLDGSNRKELLYIRGLPRHIYSLKIMGKFLIYDDWYAKTITRVNMENGKVADVVKCLMRPTEFVIHDVGFTSTCPSGHGCAEKCFTYPGGYECGCPAGKRLKADGKSCEPAHPQLASDSQCQGVCSSTANTVCAKRASSTEFTCQCKPGYYASSTGCKECEVNKYSDMIGAAQCTVCPQGSSTNNAKGRRSCDCVGDKIWAQGRCYSSYPEECPAKPVSPSCQAAKTCSQDTDCNGQKCCGWGACGQRCKDPVSTNMCYEKGKTYGLGMVFYPHKCTVCMCVQLNLVGGRKLADKQCYNKCTPEPTKKKAPVFENCIDDHTYSLTIPDDSSSAMFNPGFKAKDYEGSSVDTIVHKPSYTYFPRGTHPVVITARDRDGQSTTCTVSLKVEDKTKPLFTTCSDVQDSTIGTKKSIGWPNPVVTDNVDQDMIVEYDKNPYTEFELDETVVTATAKDSSGNEAICQFKVKLTSSRCNLPPPGSIPYGVIRRRGGSYVLECMPGIQKNDNIPDRFQCANGVLSPALTKDQLKNACMKKEPKKARRPIRFIYVNCPDVDGYKNDVKNIFIRICKGNLRYVRCEDIKVNCKDTSRKRTTATNTVIEAEAVVETNATVTKTDALKMIEKAVKDVQDKLNDGSFTLNIDGQDVNPIKIDTDETKFGCDEGRMEKDGNCYVCPSGTYYDGSICSLCAKNTYQNLEGQLNCKSCPDDKTSEKGAFSLYQCKQVSTPPPSGVKVWVIVVIVVVVLLVIVVVVIVIVIVKKRKSPNTGGDRGVSIYDNPAYGDHPGKIQTSEYETGEYETIPADKMDPDHENPYSNLKSSKGADDHTYAGLNK